MTKTRNNMEQYTLATISAEDEAQLILRAQNGERNAFSELVRIHARGVFNVVFHMCGDALIADDAAQETFIRAWQNLRSYRPQTSLRNWLYRIAFNAGMDMLRKEKRILPNDIDEMDLRDERSGPEAQVSQQERTTLVQKAVLSLPDASRAVLVLREYEGMSYSEIADALDIPLGTVMSRLNYARKLLKENLQPQLVVSVEADYVQTR
jgi:RNA polymerase sigma-70 factor (ECF subfamily)